MRSFLLAALLVSIAQPVADPPFRLTALTRQNFNQHAQTAPRTNLRLRKDLQKKNGVLTIPLPNGQKKVFKDWHLNTDEDDQVRYTYRGYLLDFKQHLVFAEYYETGEWLLLSEEGKVLKLWSEPLCSPDRTKLLTYAGSLEYDIMPTGLQLFQLAQGKLVKQWEYKTTKWEPKRVFWLTNQQLCMQAQTADVTVASGGGKTFYRTITLP